VQPYDMSTNCTFPNRVNYQQGIVLFLFLLTVIAIFGITLISISAGSARLLQREKNAREILNQTRLAVIGRGIGAISPAARPGKATFPDILAGTPAVYDGKAASGCFNSSQPNGLPVITTGATMRCLGRLPWKDFGIQPGFIGEDDVMGEMPWYALSPNLADQCLDVLNSNTVNRIYTGYVCNGYTLPHPWLTVRDSKGAILSDQVAMVFIVPGPPVAGQARNPYPNLGGANQYLDSTTISGTTYSNADLDNDFIIGSQTDTFNDVVSYITIDEWMTHIEQRVGAELINSVASLSNPKSFRNIYMTLPWLAPFADPSVASSYLPTVNVTQGLLPVYSAGIDYPTPFLYRFDSTGLSYSTNAPAIPKLIMDGFVGVTRTVTAISGTCRWTTIGKSEVACKEKIITGLSPGVAKRIVEISVLGPPTVSVTYSAATASTLTTRNVLRPSGGANGLFTVTDYNSANVVIASSYVTGGIATASVSGMILPLNEVLPNWFAENRWQEVAYAAIAPDFAPGKANVCAGACLTVGKRNDFHFAVLTAGSPLTSLSQTRPSSQLGRYLDSAENLNIDNIFTEKTSVRTTSYNDQIFAFP
jgi:hypothetical protein